MATVTQVHLTSGTTHRTCWVPVEKPFRVGNTVTLKNSEDPERGWVVTSVGTPTDSSQINRGWNNNI